MPENTVLNPRNEFVKPWNELTDDEKKVYARYMEVYAGFLEHADAQIGKVVDYLKEIGEFENTLLYCSPIMEPVPRAEKTAG